MFCFLKFSVLQISCNTILFYIQALLHSFVIYGSFHCQEIYSPLLYLLAKVETFLSGKLKQLNFQKIQVQIFRSNGKVKKVQTISMCTFQERNVPSLSIWGNIFKLQTAYRNFVIICQIVSHSNIDFLISKENKAPKIDPKMLKQQAGITILRHALSFT